MMQGKTVLVTGATNGIGEVAARELARAGAQVIIVSRSAQKCADTAQRIQQQTGNNAVSYIASDLSLLSGIRAAAATFRERYDRLDVLLNNAGGLFSSRQLTSEGLEMTFALNHMSYFLLTHLLLDVLKATAKQAGEARVVSVSSDAHHATRGIRFDDLKRDKRYSAFGAYAESKLMNVLFTQELAQRLQGTGVTANALHPGFVRTGFGKNNNPITSFVFGLIQAFALTPEQGAQTSIYLASDPSVRGVTGKYFSKKKPAAVNKVCQDIAVQQQLWRISEEIAGITPTL